MGLSQITTLDRPATSGEVFLFQQLRVDLAQARQHGGPYDRIDLGLAVALGAADLAGQAPVEAQQGLLDRLGLARRRGPGFAIELGEGVRLGFQRPLSRGPLRRPARPLQRTGPPGARRRARRRRAGPAAVNSPPWFPLARLPWCAANAIS